MDIGNMDDVKAIVADLWEIPTDGVPRMCFGGVALLHSKLPINGEDIAPSMKGLIRDRPGLRYVVLNDDGLVAALRDLIDAERTTNP
ncbi:hypothetical protein LCGC14_1619570 [marine sediment metagenome]|uniref:Uncharacterized protein n=1 Tax=marine sediment metagenome TaxID=412755 RepID=A0A0F9ISP8_9ZZZZ